MGVSDKPNIFFGRCCGLRFLIIEFSKHRRKHKGIGIYSHGNHSWNCHNCYNNSCFVRFFLFK